MMLSNTFRASANRILQKLYCILPKLLLKLFVSEMRCHSCTAGGRRRSLLSWGQCSEGEGYRFRWRLQFFWRGHGFKKRRPYFTRYFLWFNFLNHLHSTLPEEKLFSRTVCRKWTHFMSNETVRNRKFNGRCSILLHSFWKLAGYYDKTFTFDDIVLATLARVKRTLSLAELQMWLLHGQLP